MNYTNWVLYHVLSEPPIGIWASDHLFIEGHLILKFRGRGPRYHIGYKELLGNTSPLGGHSGAAQQLLGPHDFGPGLLGETLSGTLIT